MIGLEKTPIDTIREFFPASQKFQLHLVTKGFRIKFLEPPRWSAVDSSTGVDTHKIDT